MMSLPMPIAPADYYHLERAIRKLDGLRGAGAGCHLNTTWRYANKDGRSTISINLKSNVELLHNFLYTEE